MQTAWTLFIPVVQIYNFFFFKNNNLPRLNQWFCKKSQIYVFPERISLSSTEIHFDNSLLYFLITQICVKVNCSIYAVNFYTNLCKAKHFGPCRQAGAKCKGPDSFPQLQTSRGSSLFSNPIGHSMAQEAISATHRLTVKNSIVWNRIL